MVNGVQGYSNMDIWKQQAQKRAAQWAQVGAQQQAAQQADSSLYVQQPVAQQAGYVQQNVPVQQVTQPTTTQEDDGTYKCTDGNDDGHIGFWNATGHALKGAGKFLAGLVGFEWGADGKFKSWNPTKALKNIAIGAGIAALCVLTAGTAVPAIIAGAGVAMAAGGVGKSIYRAATAKTDAECKAAFNDLGSDGMALGLSLVGAKASMKQYATAKGLDAAKYDGVLGTARTAWDSTTLGFKQAGNGLKAGYNAYKSGGWTNVKAVITESGRNFGNIVKANYAKAIKTPTVEETQQAKVDKIDKQIENLKAKAAKAEELAKAKKSAHPEKAPQKLKFERQIKRLEAQKTQVQQAYNDINSVKSFDAAQTKISEVESNIAKLERNLENATTRAQKYKYTKALNEAKQQLNIYKNVVDAKTSQARNLQAQIERCNKEGLKDGTSTKRFEELAAKQKKLREQQEALDFDLPKGQHKTYAETVTKSSTELAKKQEAYNNAQKEYAEALKAAKNFAKDDISENAMAAWAKEARTKNILSHAKASLDEAKIQVNKNEAFSNATSGYDYQGTITARATAMTKYFNNQYGTMNTPFKGSKIPLTNYTIPGYNLGIGKGWTIAATGDLTGGFGSIIPGVDNISVNSKDEISLEDILISETSGMTPIQAHSLMELQAQAQAQPQQYIQATPQVQQVPQQGTSGSRPLTPADWEMFNYQLNAYGVA